jgi:hypothetical protein
VSPSETADQDSNPNSERNRIATEPALYVDYTLGRQVRRPPLRTAGGVGRAAGIRHPRRRDLTPGAEHVPG